MNYIKELRINASRPRLRRFGGAGLPNAVIRSLRVRVGVIFCPFLTKSTLDFSSLYHQIKVNSLYANIAASSQYDSIITRITKSFSGGLGVLYMKADEVVFLVKEAPKPLLGPTLTPYYPTNQSIQSIQPI